MASIIGLNYPELLSSCKNSRYTKHAYYNKYHRYLKNQYLNDIIYIYSIRYVTRQNIHKRV